MKFHIFLLAITACFLSGCGSKLCTKGETSEGVLFEYGSFPGKHVDIGAAAVHLPDSSWVRVLKVKDGEGFLLVTAQKTVHCDKDETKKAVSSETQTPASCPGRRIIEKHKVYRYTENGGYEEWLSDEIPEKEWRTAESIHHKFSKKPRFHYTNCRYHFLGGFYKFLGTLRRY